MRAWHLDEGIDTAELVISELVTNAVRAAPYPEPPYADLCDVPLVGVELRAAGHVFRIAVQDCGAGRPVLQKVTEVAENGRGLFLVEALSTRWDVEPEPTGGKVTWAELELAVKEHMW
jgi:anti-sigma regulatory factor (Ser/Thr protein kinase)